MAARPVDCMPLTEDDLEPYGLLGLLFVFGLLSVYLIRPYLFYLLGAVILVYLSYPVYRQVEEWTGRARVAALAVLTALLAVAVLPTIFFADLIVRQAQLVAADLGSDVFALIDTTALEAQFMELTGEQVDLDQTLRSAFFSAGQFFSTRLPSLISTVLDAVIGVGVMAITMYYLFKDGDAVVDHVRELFPMPAEQTAQLFEEVDTMSEALLVGHVLTATTQALLAGLGLLAVGIPNVVFWTFAMILFGIIPIAGTFFIWGPAGVYLLVVADAPLAGAGLLIYGTVMMVVSDQLIRAQLVGRRARIHPLLVILGVIGGIPLFGLLGIVLGPLVMGVFAALLRVYQDGSSPGTTPQ